MMPPMPITDHARRRHKASHGVQPVPMEDCWKCQKSWAYCRYKITYDSREAVDVAVKEINERFEYRNPVKRYPCDWGDHYHVARCKKPHELKRARNHMRKWLLEKRLAEAT